MPEEVKLAETYSVWTGLKKAVVKTVLPAVGVAAVGLLADPDFVAAVQNHLSTVAGGGVLSLALMFVVNWAKNKNLGK